MPCMSKDTSMLLKEYEETGDQTTEKQFLRQLDIGRQKAWNEKMEFMDFTHSSKKCGHYCEDLEVVNSHRKSGNPV